MSQRLIRQQEEQVPGINSSHHQNLEKFYSMNRSSMALPDKLLLDPIDKFEQHNRFPWKMVIHIILVCLTTALVLLLITDVADYRRNLEIMWSSLFLTENGDYEGMDPAKSLYLYNAAQVSNFVNTSVHNYYGVNDMTLQSFQLPSYSNGTAYSPEVRVTPLSFQDYKQSLIFKIDKDNQYPFSDLKALKKFVSQVSSFAI